MGSPSKLRIVWNVEPEIKQKGYRDIENRKSKKKIINIEGVKIKTSSLKLKIGKNGFKKFAKGMFAIFTIKLLLVGTIFVIQSCQTDNEIFENSEKQITLNKFESLAKKIKVSILILMG